MPPSWRRFDVWCKEHPLGNALIMASVWVVAGLLIAVFYPPLRLTGIGDIVLGVLLWFPITYRRGIRYRAQVQASDVKARHTLP